MNKLQSFARECISDYATFNKNDEFYSLNTSDLPDFIKNEFAGIIMSDDNSWAKEATGPDNKHWETRMLPALTRYLKNSTDKDEAIEFNNTWRDCVADYLNGRMQELIDDSIADVFT